MTKFSPLLLLAFLLPTIAVLGACGGGGDDDDDDDGGSGSTSNSSGGDATRASSGNSNQSSSGSGVKLPTIKDGNFEKGSLHLEVSGDKDFKLDFEGNGLTTGGYTLLTYLHEDGSVVLAFQADDAQEPGGMALTVKELATAAEWGKDCTVSIDDGSKEVKGEFTCKQIDGVTPGSTKTYKVKITGKFTAQR